MIDLNYNFYLRSIARANQLITSMLNPLYVNFPLAPGIIILKGGYLHVLKLGIKQYINLY